MWTPGTGGATALCLDTDDLAVSKLVAGRPKDAEFVAAMLRHGLTTRARIESRLRDTPIDTRAMGPVVARLNRLAPAD